MIHWRDRVRAAGLHFGASLAIALLAGLLVFVLWYPYPYREISGGRELFLIVIAVDVVLGPLITLAIFNRAKPWTELRRDLAVVVLIQLAGLGYGLWTVAVARPVHLVFELDRFRVVHAVEVPQDLMDKVPADVRALPWAGPSLLAVRPFRSAQEGTDATMVALQGIALGARPDLWQPYESARERVLKAAKPVTALKARFPASAGVIDEVARVAGRSADTLVYLPMVGRKYFWTVLLDPATAQPVGYVPLDSF